MKYYSKLPYLCLTLFYFIVFCQWPTFFLHSSVISTWWSSWRMEGFSLCWRSWAALGAKLRKRQRPSASCSLSRGPVASAKRLSVKAMVSSIKTSVSYLCFYHWAYLCCEGHLLFFVHPCRCKSHRRVPGDIKHRWNQRDSVRPPGVPVPWKPQIS